jgi:hypothetical protein
VAARACKALYPGSIPGAASSGFPGIQPEARWNPASPLHTHDETGMLHTEVATHEILTLGQYFLEWGVRLDGDCVGDYCTPATDIAVYVDGDRFRGNPADIPLTDRTEIAIVIGSPPERIPDDADFSRA